ncbi:hypothetical protein [Marinobacter salarius]|uniref:hypothetical protein n=1 Tax=Marinobacter salarius TaxID=1420917 RepID=UPI0032EF373C
MPKKQSKRTGSDAHTAAAGETSPPLLTLVCLLARQAAREAHHAETEKEKNNG